MHNSPKYMRKIKRSANDIIFASMFLYLMGVFYYGLNCLFLGAVAVLTARVFDIVIAMIQNKERDKKDYSSIMIALLIGAVLPATAPYWIAVLGVIVALSIAKYPFGGSGSYIVSPVGVAFAFLILNFPDLMLKYPVPFQKMGIIENIAVKMSSSPAYSLKQMGIPTTAPLDLILGNYAGPLGVGCGVVVVGCAVFLLVRRAIDYRIPVAFLSTVCLIALIFPRLQSGALDSLFYEVFATGTLFYAVFLSSDYTVNPVRFSGKIIYGVLLGILTMLCRYFGAFEIGFPFALIICDAITPFIDKIAPQTPLDQRYAEVTSR